MRRITPLLISAFTIVFTQLAQAQFLGGNNDGASVGLSCATDLNGGAAFSLSAVSGSSEFCNFATQSYSIVVTGGTQDQTYLWSVPAGASIISGQGTTSILAQFGSTSGNVRIDVTNACSTLFSTLPVTAGSCVFFQGGTNDGHSLAQDCASNLNGGSVFIPGGIVGSTTFCEFATETYSITVGGSTAETVYSWTVPAGATISSGQGTTSILVTFGNTSGNVSVDVSNACETINVPLAVTLTSCTFFAGGVNDGFSQTQDCASNLNGGSVFIPGPIVGSTTFCDFASETYTITVAGSLPTTMYDWSVPVGATITSGQGTNTILVSFGNTAGNVSVNISNECETVPASLAVAPTACLFYAGGVNDGFAQQQACISSLNGTSAFIPGPIVGSVSFCDFATESYSISVAGANASTTYNWTVPPGATITSGQGTTSILVTFGNTAGNIAVDISNECETVPVTLAVAPTSCLFYAGGVNDGFSNALTCISSLGGSSAFIPGPIVGSTAFCDFASESYTITVAGANASTMYAWTAPAGATITSGQGTNTILVAFGNTAGNIGVTISNECESVPVTLAVAPTSCIFYAGGNADGFAFTLVNNIPLPIELLSFEAKVQNGIVALRWITASELNNDYFTIERSTDGEHFETVLTLKGAGTTSEQRSYKAEDRFPFVGRSYYRLVQTDYDGTMTYSQLVLVEVQDIASGVVALYPNPVANTHELAIEYMSGEEETIRIAVFDTAGRLLQVNSVTVIRGSNTIRFKADFPSSGTYLIQVGGAGKTQSFRLFVE
ncbi:MAG: T9SS type A sorting domain-containing protein [Cyclobacteriaceae bacterium]